MALVNTAYSGFVSLLTLSLGNTQSYKKLLANLPKFVPAGDNIFIILVRKQISLPLQRETLFLSSRAVCYTNMLEERVQNKTWYKIYRNVMENCLSTVTFFVWCYIASKFQ